jgi:hypothetical protein
LLYRPGRAHVHENREDREMDVNSKGKIIGLDDVHFPFNPKV